MATRRKTLTTPVNLPKGLRDPWKNTEESALVNGVQVFKWENEETGNVKWVGLGLHPEDEEPVYEPIHEYAEETNEVEETSTDRVLTLLQNSKGEGRSELNVYRFVNGERQYCAKYKPEEFEEGTFEMLRSNFGAGEYELRLYATDPRTGRFVVRSQTRVKIAESKTPNQVDALPSGLSQVLTTIAQGQEQMLRAIVDMKQTPQKDPMEEMTKMLSMMTLMREAMGITNQSREKSSIREIVDAVKELKGAAEEFTPKEKEEDSLMGMLPKVLEMVSAGQTQQQVQQQIQPAFIPPVAVPQSVQQQTQQTQQQGGDVNLMTMIKLKGYLKSLCDMAQAEKSIAEGANFVYDNLPDDLIEIMMLDNWFDLLSGVAPEVKPHEVWLKNVRDMAIGMFQDPEETQDPKI